VLKAHFCLTVLARNHGTHESAGYIDLPITAALAETPAEVGVLREVFAEEEGVISGEYMELVWDMGSSRGVKIPLNCARIAKSSNFRVCKLPVTLGTG
jgi:hypothetical protein